MSTINEPTFSDMLTTQDLTGLSGENNGKQMTKNHRNASEFDAAKNYGKKKTTKEMKDVSSCKTSKRKKK